MNGDSRAIAICGYSLMAIAAACWACGAIWLGIQIASRVRRRRAGPPPIPPLPVDGEPLDDGERADLAGIERDLDPEPAPAAGTAWWPFWRPDGGPR